MKRNDCEKLLGAYRESVIAGNHEAAQMLFEVIVGIMADEKKPAYRDGGVVVRDAPIQWPGVTTAPVTIPVHVTKPIITCDGTGEISLGHVGSTAVPTRTTAKTATRDNSKED